MIRVRQALLEDAGAINAVYRSMISRWTRRADDDSRVEADYEELSLYERWQHGGPWLAIETCSVWLGHLLQSEDGIPLVAELDGQIVGQAEVFIGQEAAPYDHHLNISTISVMPEARNQGVGTALVAYIEEMGQALGCKKITISYAEPTTFFESLGFAPLASRQRVLLKAEEGRVFYKARDLTDDRPHQIQGWFMSMGRFQNAREEWERMYWRIWNGVPALVESRWHRLIIDLTGQPGILHLHQYDEDQGSVTARLWTKFPLSTHIISAVRDRAARLGYQRLTTLVNAEDRILLPDALDDGPPQWLYAKVINK